MNFFIVMGTLIIAGLGITISFFRKGGVYNPSMPSLDRIPPDEYPIPASVPDPRTTTTSTPEGVKTAQVTSSSPTPTNPTLAQFCAQIALYEGGPGDANHRNNNPGNCRYNPSGYLPMYEPVGKSPAGFAIFKDWNTGMLYLQNMIRGMIHKRPNETILQFMQRYAPSSENDPVKYATFIAKGLGVNNSFLMRDLV